MTAVMKMTEQVNKELTDYITQLIMEELERYDLAPAREPLRFVPVGVSARHVHVSAEHMELLFGRGKTLTKFKEISQPGQFAANEKVALIGPKGVIENVRILGPFRNNTQIEIAASEARRLGVHPPVRESGRIAGSPGLQLAGPHGSITLEQGCIIAERHIHMTPADARAYGVQHGQKVQVKVTGAKGGIMDCVSIKVRADYALEIHIDTDDSNAFGIKQGDTLEILR
ncbi:phosphate propanoyltransferase [Paenibacillus apiarius]|uniref:phosphate propanoyltransferase n=1 Tax=Paenibacillus apiarius TaxID=46240 RepID=UPI003B3A248F